MNVLMIVVDSLRADHLGCYDYHKNTSPNIDALASEGTLLTQTFAPGIPTTPAFTTLLSGLHPYRHGILAHGGDVLLRPEIQMLPQMAKQAGYTTIGIDNLAVQGSGRGSWFTRGFDYYSGFLYQPHGTQSTQLADRTINFLTEFKDDPFFLFLHLWDPHTPYAPPAPFDTLHYEEGANPPEKLQEIKALSQEYYDAFLGDMHFQKPEDFDWIMAQYDGEISYADQQIGRILDHVKTLGLWDDTAVVVLSDHGECFGEGDFWFDHHGLYDANLRVASIWRVPGQQPQRRDDFVSTDEVFATLCELCRWPKPDYMQEARSFAPLLQGQTLPERDFFVGVECSRQASLCVRTSQWKLILPISKDGQGQAVPNFYGEAREEKALLYNLQDDPDERRDVSEEFPEIRDELLAQLTRWREEQREQSGGRDLILESPLGLPYDEFMERLLKRGVRR